MFSDPRYRRIMFGAAILAVLMIFSPAFPAEAGVATLPPYRSSGPIPGTSLIYDRLAINDRGGLTITIVNPTNSGVAFFARFSFYDNRDTYLTGFTVEGFASANGRTVHALEVDNNRAYRRATTMRVLGRSGRMGRDPDIGDGGEFQ